MTEPDIWAAVEHKFQPAEAVRLGRLEDTDAWQRRALIAEEQLRQVRAEYSAFVTRTIRHDASMRSQLTHACIAGGLPAIEAAAKAGARYDDTNSDSENT